MKTYVSLEEVTEVMQQLVNGHIEKAEGDRISWREYKPGSKEANMFLNQLNASLVRILEDAAVAKELGISLEGIEEFLSPAAQRTGDS